MYISCIFCISRSACGPSLIMLMFASSISLQYDIRVFQREATSYCYGGLIIIRYGQIMLIHDTRKGLGRSTIAQKVCYGMYIIIPLKYLHDLWTVGTCIAYCMYTLYD